MGDENEFPLQTSNTPPILPVFFTSVPYLLIHLSLLEKYTIGG
jgi:hypothetical protein